MAHDELDQVWLLHAHQLRNLLGHPGTNVGQAAITHELPPHREPAVQATQHSTGDTQTHTSSMQEDGAGGRVRRGPSACMQASGTDTYATGRPEDQAERHAQATAFTNPAANRHTQATAWSPCPSQGTQEQRACATHAYRGSRVLGSVSIHCRRKDLQPDRSRPPGYAG